MGRHEASTIDSRTPAPHAEQAPFADRALPPMDMEAEPGLPVHQVGQRMTSTPSPTATFIAHRGGRAPATEKPRGSGVGSFVGEAGRRITRIPLDLIDNTIVVPVREGLTVAWNIAIKSPAQLLWNGRYSEHEPKSLKRRATGAGMLVALPITIPLMFAVGFLAGEILNLPNTIQDPFKMAIMGRVGQRDKYRRLNHENDDGTWRSDYNV